MLLTVALLCLLAGALFRRQLFLMLRMAMWLALALVGVRFVASLDLPSVFWTGATGGAILGFLLVGVLCFTFIYNFLVERDRAADHAGVDKKHDGRRI